MTRLPHVSTAESSNTLRTIEAASLVDRAVKSTCPSSFAFEEEEEELRSVSLSRSSLLLDLFLS